MVIDKEMIYTKKNEFLKIFMSLYLLFFLSACSMQQEESNTENEKPIDGMIDNVNENTESDFDSSSITKIEKYEGFEITDWIDEQTVVVAKENRELEKMSLLENAEYYPRSIYLYNLDTKEFNLIIAKDNMFLGGATLSPDKNHLLYYEYSIGDVAYYLMSLEDGVLSSEDNIASAYTAGWTDEQHVIGVSYLGGAFIADTTGNLSLISELQEEHLFTLQKIKEKIYYITTDSPSFQLYKLDLKTKEKKNLQLENANNITLSPDGKHLLITQATGSTKSLLISDTNGEIQSKIAEGSDVTDASWSPNQQYIAYQLNSIIDGVERSGIYLYDVSTGKSKQIAQNVEYAKLKWSPSGKKISVIELDERNYNSSIIYIK